MAVGGSGVQLFEAEIEEDFLRILYGTFRYSKVLMVLVFGNGWFDFHICDFLCLPKASLAPLFKWMRCD